MAKNRTTNTLRVIAGVAWLVSSGSGIAAPPAACLVMPGPDHATTKAYRNDCGHPITVVKVAMSGGTEQCFRAEMLEGKTWQLTPKDKACSVLVAQDAPGSKCDCPAGTAIDLAHAPAPTGPRTLSARENAENHQVVLDACTSNRLASVYVDCGCLAEKVSADQQKNPDIVWQALAERNYERCPKDKQSISDDMFATCDQMNRSIRADHAQFCRCASDRAADAYLAQPKFNLRYIESLKKDALVKCSATSSTTPH